MTDIDKIVADAIAVNDTKPEEGGEDLRDRLVGIAVAGKSQEFLGKNITSDEIERLDQNELRKLYARYENRMGGLVTKSLKRHVVVAYTKLVGWLLPKSLVIADTDALEVSLNEGPFIDIALEKWSCGMYHRFGHMLGPLEAVLLTGNHIQKNPVVPEEPPAAGANTKAGVDEID